MKIIRIIKKVVTAVKNWVNTTLTKKQKYIHQRNQCSDPFMDLNDITSQTPCCEYSDDCCETCDNVSDKQEEQNDSVSEPTYDSTDTNNNPERETQNEKEHIKEEPNDTVEIQQDKITIDNTVNNSDKQVNSDDKSTPPLDDRIGRIEWKGRNRFTKNDQFLMKFCETYTVYEYFYSEYEKLVRKSQSFKVPDDDTDQFTIVYNYYKDFERLCKLITDESGNIIDLDINPKYGKDRFDYLPVYKFTGTWSEIEQLMKEKRIVTRYTIFDSRAKVLTFDFLITKENESKFCKSDGVSIRDGEIVNDFNDEQISRFEWYQCDIFGDRIMLPCIKFINLKDLYKNSYPKYEKLLRRSQAFTVPFDDSDQFTIVYNYYKDFERLCKLITDESGNIIDLDINPKYGAIRFDYLPVYKFTGTWSEIEQLMKRKRIVTRYAIFDVNSEILTFDYLITKENESKFNKSDEIRVRGGVITDW